MRKLKIIFAIIFLIIFSAIGFGCNGEKETLSLHLVSLEVAPNGVSNFHIRHNGDAHTQNTYFETNSTIKVLWETSNEHEAVLYVNDVRTNLFSGDELMVDEELTLRLRVYQTGVRLGSVADGAPVFDGITVTINGENLAMHSVYVTNTQTWVSVPTRTPAAVGYVYKSHGKSVEVVVDFGEEINSNTIIRPVHRGITPEIINGTKARFVASGHGTYIIEPNGNPHRAVFLFMDEFVSRRRAPDTENVIRFTKGLWDYTNHPAIQRSVQGGGDDYAVRGMVTLQSNTTVIIEEGAFVRAGFFGRYVENIRITGRGIIDGSTFTRRFPEGGLSGRQTIPIEFQHSSNIVLEDFAVHDPAGWVVHSFFVEDSVMDGIRMFTSRTNGDGISLQSNRNIHVKNVFVRAWDDALVVKNYPIIRNSPEEYWGSTYNLLFENSELWSDLAQAMEIGFETVGQQMENITFRNITVFHAFHKPPISINNGNNAYIRNILWENITIENAAMGGGDAAWDRDLIGFRIAFSSTWSTWNIAGGTPLGQVDGVVIRNVFVLDGIRDYVEMRFEGARHNFRNQGLTYHIVQNVKIENVYLRGQRVEIGENLVVRQNAQARNITLDGNLLSST
ncbi:MAG: hypothetical protein FWC11_04085 [Firmicutes bacterium]|nr:hypothetical protein [Bacillota bacterium]MCL2256021.1 hypothetical protein [Bacillota bacterium]